MDFNNLKKQAPDERVKILKKFIRELTKEITEKQALLKTAESFLKDSEEELKIIENVQVTEEIIEPVSLEETAVQTFEELGLPQEPEQLARAPIEELYTALKTLYSSSQFASPNLSYEEREKQRLNLYALNKALDVKRERIRKGEYKPTEKAAHLLTATEELINRMYDK